jgi:peptide/nickel transport system ATP-binding protein
VYDDPRHPYTQRLVAAVPTLAKALAGIGPGSGAALDAAEVAATTFEEDLP